MLNSSLFVALLLAFLSAVSPMNAAVARDDPATATAKKAAVDAMRLWITDVDAGYYAKSWSDASPLLKKTVSSAEWIRTNKRVRGGFGHLVSRQLLSLDYKKDEPKAGSHSAPEELVIAQFLAAFVNATDIEETVAFVKDHDGTWRAAAYFIKAGG